MVNRMDELLKVLLNYPNGTKLYLKWKSGYEIVGKIDTVYETDNGLEMNDEAYEEYYACAIKVDKVVCRPKGIVDFIKEEDLIEVSKYNKPDHVMLYDGLTNWGKTR